jgi:hypothetical protein
VSWGGSWEQQQTGEEQTSKSRSHWGKSRLAAAASRWQCQGLAAAPDGWLVAEARGGTGLAGVRIHFGFHRGETGQLDLGFPELGRQY